MEHYIVSARKYRPSTFNTVIGQKALTAALKHAVATDRLAHAYLFCGSRGVGKTSCARIFAKTINCKNRTPEGEACNQCDSCRDFNNGTSMNIIELDAASHNGIDDIKSLTEQVMVPPTQGRYRVFIIDEVHMLSSAAFNAFLKTLEEPPEYVIFILATTEKHKIISTILSRCQIYDFNRITIQDMVEHLMYVASNEGITAEPAALNVIARKADGAMRDALSIFDQVAASTMGNVSYQNTIANLNILDHSYYSRLVDAFLADDVPTALLIYKEVREKGFDSQFFINGLALYLRDLMVAMNPATISLLEASDDVRAEMAAIAAKCTPKWLYAAMDLCNDADLNFRIATNKQFLVELTLIKICQLSDHTPSTVQQAPTIKPISPQPANTPQPAVQPTVQPAAQPVQQATPQPAAPTRPMPSPTAYQPTPQRAQTTGRPNGRPSFSINGRKEAAPAPTVPIADATKRNAPFTIEQLNAAWLEYISSHPEERILTNTMKASMPQLLQGESYQIEVDDVIQVNTFNEAKSQIMALLRQRLSNDFVDVKAVIRQGESSPIVWTERELLSHMATEHPAIKDLINDFSMNL